MNEALADLDRRTVRALQTGDVSGLDVIGYGEISTVLRLDTPDGSFVAKRLPPFPGAALATYEAVFADYLTALERRGLTPAPSELEVIPGEAAMTVYCLQPLYDTLLVDRLREAGPEETATLARRLVAAIAPVVSPRLALDGQVANWALDGDRLVYVDVTTPLIRDDRGRERADLGLFIASLPAAVRWVVRRFLLAEILSHYYDLRAVLVDLTANLIKEQLQPAIPAFLEASNEAVPEPITRGEVEKYYRSDALMWEVLQRLRRADRWWQRTVRRRTYPFLLPGRVER